METKQPNLIDKFIALPKGQRIAIIIGIIVILGLLGRTDKNNSSSSSSTQKSDSYESTTPSFTCNNCGGHSFNYHETVTDMKVCNSCGVGN